MFIVTTKTWHKVEEQKTSDIGTKVCYETGSARRRGQTVFVDPDREVSEYDSLRERQTNVINFLEDSDMYIPSNFPKTYKSCTNRQVRQYHLRQ